MRQTLSLDPTTENLANSRGSRNNLELRPLRPTNRLIETRLIMMPNQRITTPITITIRLLDKHPRDRIIRITRIGHNIHLSPDRRDSTVGSSGAGLREDGAGLEAGVVCAGAGCCEAGGVPVLLAVGGEAVVVGAGAAAKLEFGDGPWDEVCCGGGLGGDWRGESWSEEGCESGGEGEALHFGLFESEIRRFVVVIAGDIGVPFEQCRVFADAEE